MASTASRVPELPVDELGVAQHAHQQVVEVVGDAACEHPQALQLLALAHALFELLSLGFPLPLLGQVPEPGDPDPLPLEVALGPLDLHREVGAVLAHALDHIGGVHLVADVPADDRRRLRCGDVDGVHADGLERLVTAHAREPLVRFEHEPCSGHDEALERGLQERAHPGAGLRQAGPGARQRLLRFVPGQREQEEVGGEVQHVHRASGERRS